MSADEKETYFDGPHMSSGDSQPPCNSMMNHSLPSIEATVPLSSSHEAHSSAHYPGSAHRYQEDEAAANDSLKDSAQCSSFQHFNGSEHPVGTPPIDQVVPADMMLVPDDNPQQFVSISGPPVHCPTDPHNNVTFEQPVVPEQPPVDETQIFRTEPSVFLLGSISEAPSTSHSMGPYMNIAYNIDQHIVPPMPQEHCINPPVSAPPVEEQVVDDNSASVMNIRSSDAAAHNNDFTIHPGPSYTHHLHQDTSEDRNRRNAEDSLHSQGSWPSQSYVTSSTAYAAPQLNPHLTMGSPPVVSIRDDVTQPNVLEVTEEHSLSQAMNNLAISDANAPVQLEELNIEADLDDTLSTTTDDDDDDVDDDDVDDAPTEKIIVVDNFPMHRATQHVLAPQSDVASGEPPGHVTSNLHPTLDEAVSQPSSREDGQSLPSAYSVSLHEDPNQFQPLEASNSRADNEVATDPSCPPLGQGQNDMKTPINIDPTLGTPHSVMWDARVPEQQSTHNIVENHPQAPADPLAPPPHQPISTSFVPPAMSMASTSSVHSTNQSIEERAAIDTLSMHSSYVSVHAHSSVTNQITSAAVGSQPPPNTPVVETPPPPFSTSVTSPSINNTSSNALRSQMVGAPSAPTHKQFRAPPSTTPSSHAPTINPSQHLTATPVHPPAEASAPSLYNPAQFNSLGRNPVQTSDAPHNTSNKPTYAPPTTHTPSDTYYNQNTSYSQSPPTVPVGEPPRQSMPQPENLHQSSEQTPYQPHGSGHVQTQSTNQPHVSGHVQTQSTNQPHSFGQVQMQTTNQPHGSGYVQAQPTNQVTASGHAPTNELPTSGHVPMQLANQQPALGHVPAQPTNRYPEQSRQHSSFPHRSSDPNLQRLNQSQPWERRAEPQRVPARPHSSMSGTDPGYMGSRDGYGFPDRGDGYGRAREERYSRDHYRWSHDQRRYDETYRMNRTYGGYSYDQRRYYPDYDPYYPHQRSYQDYYDRQYDQWGRPYRYDQWSGYYADHPRRSYYDDEEDRRSVYSERSGREGQRYPPDESYNTGYQDPNSTQQGYLEDPSFNETYYPSSYNDDAYQDLPQVPDRSTPAKFSCAHPVARFGSGGHLVVIMPQQSADQSTSSVQLHSVETLLFKNEEAEKLQKFPGPLSKGDTHKNDAVQYITSQSRKCAADLSLRDRQSTALVWDFLALMVRQNGAVMGTDIAELLMHDHSGDFALLDSPNETQERLVLSQDGASAPENDEMEQVASEYSHGRPVHHCPSVRFRELLLYGRKKDALEWAMKSNLWGHALLLASKTDARTHATVMLRFANSLPINDPLQTLYQLMSGRQPASTTCIADEGWGDWRPHLAMILSNSTDNTSFDAKLLLTMGDTLSSRRLVDAAHFCYLMASVPLSFYAKKSNKLVLIGSSHARPFKQFALNDAIERTETYEYAIALSSSTRQAARTPVHFPPLQIYKFIYACRLLEFGMVAKAFHYLENIARLVIHSPSSYSITLVSQLAAIVERLKLHDSRVQAGTLRESDLQWTRNLNTILDKMTVGSIIPSTISYARSSTLSDVGSSGVLSSHPHDESDQSDDEDEDTDVGELTKYPAASYNQTWQQPHYEPPSLQAATEQVPAPNFGASHQIPNYGLPPQSQVISPVAPAPPLIPVDRELSQASIPPLPGMTQPGPPFQPPPMFQPNTQFSSTPNTSMMPPPQPPHISSLAPPTHPPHPVHSQEETKRDFYDQISSVPPELQAGSRLRTESQTSYGSRRSRISRKSSGRRARTISERSKQSRSRSTSAESDKKSMKQEKEKIHWDPDLKRWVDANATEEEKAPFQPPPMDTPDVDPPSSEPQAAPASGMTRNKFSLKNLNNRSMYKNAFSSTTTPSNGAMMAPPVLPPAAAPATMFMPTPAATQPGEVPNQPEPVPMQPSFQNQPMGAEPPTQPAPQGLGQLMPGQAAHPGGPPQQMSGPPAHATHPGVPPQQMMLRPNQYQNNFNQDPAAHPQAPPAQAQAPPPSSIPGSAPSAGGASAPPPMATFYNPSQFQGGPNLFSQPSGGLQRKRE